MKHPISPDTSGLYEKIWKFFAVLAAVWGIK